MNAPVAGSARAASGALRWLWLSALIVVLDQATKALIVARFELYERSEWLPMLEITRLHNRGAAFSFLHDASGWQHYFFVSVACIASAAIVWWLSRPGPARSRLLGAGLALILGGALGNLADRLLRGHVIDFIHFHWYERWYFPAFNCADAAITIGAALLMLDSLFNADTDRAPAP